MRVNPRLADLSLIILIKILYHKVMDPDDIYRVLGRMEVYLDICETDPKLHGISPFLYTYSLITKTVAVKRLERNCIFQDKDSLEDLDIYFAELFFAPFMQYLKTGIAPAPWKTFFEYCGDSNGQPFLQMLLGINAHINGDLANALINTKADNRHDFLMINQILHGEIPSILKYLIWRKDWIALGAYALPAETDRVFRDIIVQWREDAWHNYQVMLKSRHPEAALEDLHNQTEKLAEYLISIFDAGQWQKKLLFNMNNIQKHRVIVK